MASRYYPQKDLDTIDKFNRELLGEPNIDKDGIINQLTGGLKSLAKQRKVQIIAGSGEFVDPDHLCVTDAEAKKITIEHSIYYQ